MGKYLALKLAYRWREYKRKYGANEEDVSQKTAKYRLTMFGIMKKDEADMKSKIILFELFNDLLQN